MGRIAAAAFAADKHHFFEPVTVAGGVFNKFDTSVVVSRLLPINKFVVADIAPLPEDEF